MDEPPDPEGKPDSGTSDPLRAVQAKVSELANRWLKDRFALRDGESAAATAVDLGVRAEQFVRGFFRGLFDKEPTEDGADGGETTPRGLEDVVPALAQATRVLNRTSHTISHAFQDYLQQNAVDPGHPSDPVVIDGRFVVRHGAQILGRVVQALGDALTHAAEPTDPAEAESQDKVALKFDMSGLFRTLIAGKSAPEADAPQADPDDEPES